jgi:hypothetical protein
MEETSTSRQYGGRAPRVSRSKDVVWRHFLYRRVVMVVVAGVGPVAPKGLCWCPMKALASSTVLCSPLGLKVGSGHRPSRI